MLPLAQVIKCQTCSTSFPIYSHCRWCAGEHKSSYKTKPILERFKYELVLVDSRGNPVGKGYPHLSLACFFIMISIIICY